MSTESGKLRVAAELQTDDNKAPVVDARRSQFVREERLNFPPVYVVVGVYRLLTVKNLYIPVWAKCKHGVVRGVVGGAGWVGCPTQVDGS